MTDQHGARGASLRPAAPGSPGAQSDRWSPLRSQLGQWLEQAAPRGWGGELRALLELFALCGFVVLRPLLEVTGASPDFFIFHAVTGGQIMLMVMLYALVPPLALWLVGLLSRLAGPRVRRAVHLATLAVLAVLFMIQLGKYASDALRGFLLVALALVATAAVLYVYLRFDPARQALRVAAVGPVVFALLFAFTSPASAVVFPDDSDGAVVEPRVTGPNPPIVMVVLDELPLTSLLDADGGIDAERFPHFARLAGESTWYRNATTVAGWTPNALPAILTGRYPSREVAPHYSQYPENLFTMLGGVYHIEASESIAQLCPPWHCGDLAGRASGGLPALLQETSSLLGEILTPVPAQRGMYDDFAEPTVAERLGDAAAAGTDGPRFRFHQVGVNQPVRFYDFLQRLHEAGPVGAHADGQPRLDFLHLLMPHTPWRYLPSGMRYEAPSPELPVDGAWWGRLAVQRMEAQLQYTDLLLGTILHNLEDSGRYDESLVVVTSDHGVALSPGDGMDGWTAGDRPLGPDNHGAEELAWVPLFIKAPGQTEPVVDDRNWQHVDLLPTLAELANVEVPWEVDGISWVSQQRTEPEKLYHSEIDDVRYLDGQQLFARILADPDAFPAVPPPPHPELLGRPVSSLAQTDGPTGTVVENRGAFDEVRLPESVLGDRGALEPGEGVLPALVWGTVPAQVGEGTPVAIAVNGRIGAVVPAVAGDQSLRFAGLIEDETLFRAGSNTLEVFAVVDGAQLQRLPVT